MIKETIVKRSSALRKVKFTFRPTGGESEIDARKVVGWGMVSFLLGVVWSIGKQVVNPDAPKTVTLDPPSPNIEEIASTDIAPILRMFMGPFYAMCPVEHRPAYKQKVMEAIEYCEMGILIENQGLKNEVRLTRTDRHEASVFFTRCINELKKVTDYCRNPSVLQEMRKRIDHLSVHLADRNVNIETIVKQHELM